MFEKFSLSTDDFDSGRFTKVARFIVKSWPLPEVITLSKAQEVLAITLGYADYHDAQHSATRVCPGEPVRRPLGLEHRLGEISDMGWEACYATVESWPLHMLGRWNMVGRPCVLGSEAINQAVEIFIENFASEQSIVDRFRVKHIPSALSLLAAELNRSSYAELQKNLGSLISGVARQSVFDRAVESLFEEFFNSRYSELICSSSGMSLTDIWKLSRNKSSFPDLYDALNGLYDSWLQQPALNRFFKGRLPSGFYNDDPNSERCRFAKPSIISFPTHRVEVHLDRVWLEESPFKAYRWKARSVNHEGLALAEAEGGFVVGPKDDMSSADLIEATEECCVAGVYAYLKKTIAVLEICGDDVADLTPSNLNTALIFESGNLLVVNYLERNERAVPGAGVALIAAVLKDLKRRYKRDLIVCGVVDSYRYHFAARQIKCLEERRAADVEKLSMCFHDLYNTGAVADLYFELETDNRLPCEYYYEAVISPFESDD